MTIVLRDDSQACPTHIPTAPTRRMRGAGAAQEQQSARCAPARTARPAPVQPARSAPATPACSAPARAARSAPAQPARSAPARSAAPPAPGVNSRQRRSAARLAAFQAAQRRRESEYVAQCDNSTPPEPVLALVPTAPRAERGGQDDGWGGADGVAPAACTTLALVPSPKRRLSFPTISGGDAQDEDARPNAKYVKTRAGIVGGT
jgi:hypothetical protein